MRALLTQVTLMHPISAFPSRSRLLQKMHFHSRLSSHTRSRRCGRIRIVQGLPVGETGDLCGKIVSRESRGSEKGWKEEDDLSPLGAKILPRVLVPPVEHPDGKRACMLGGATTGCSKVLIGMYIIFGRFATVSRHCGYPLPFANMKLAARRNTYDWRLCLRSNTLFPKVH